MSYRDLRGVLPSRPSHLALVVAAVCASGAVSAQTATGNAAPATELREVVVSASGFEQDIKEAPASITVIPREELAKGRFGSLTDALESVEGIDVGAPAGKTGGLNISIRGMPSDYTLVLIDGRRQNSAGNVTPNGFGETQTSFMPPIGAIERIEVIRGPMSTLYGSDAMGGVINIITRKVGKTWTGSVSADYTLQQESEFGDIKSGKFYLSGPIKEDLLGLSIRGSTQRRAASDITYAGANGQPAVPLMGGNPVKSEINNLGLRLALTPNRYHDITLDLDSGRQTYDNSRGQLGTLGLQGGYGPEQKYNRDQLTLAHTGRFGFGTWDTSFMVNRTETMGRTVPPGTPGATPGAARTLEVESKVLDSKLVLPWGAHLTTLGGQWWDAEMKDGVAPNKFAFTQKALFAEDEWSLTDAFKLTMGARYDRHSLFGGKLSPRIYGVWNAAPQWTVKGGVSNGYKTPRVEQLAPGINGFGQQGRLPLVGSPNLKPETSRTTELGVYFDSPTGFAGSATVFNNEFKDKITSGPGLINCDFAAAPNRPGCVSFGNWPLVDAFGQSINVDEAVTRGLELSARMPLARGWNASANYTFTRSEQKSGPNRGNPLSDTPKHALNARLNWEPGAQWNLWLRAEYRSERFRDPGTSASSQAAKAALGNYKAYTQFHLGGSYRVSKQFTINAAIYNLFNKDFVDYQPYNVPGQVQGTVIFGNRYANNQEGRRLWVSANYEF
ncbi:TonB-dependent receptor domain-containing protein [Delftia acidovorans]|uniref:TonB-dependent receptor n=1 Tax=Delftia acidovorans TaxID=80866 RepID=A0AAJ2R0C2_DELAC|nr:TonB-dependent receptor [Delftia acidovorans]MDX4952942.1 TonB-dependent receptor [Delftia acidovorans]